MQTVVLIVLTFVLWGSMERGETPFDRFVTLVQYDNSLTGLRRRIIQAEHVLSAANAAYEQSVALLSQARERLLILKKSKNLLEHELAEIDQNLAQKNKRLDQTREAREYEALLHEIERLKTMRQEKEDPLITLWQQLEESEPAFIAFEEVQQGEIDKEGRVAEESKNELARLKEDYRLLAEKRLDFLPGILPEWLSRYEALHKRVENPAAVMDKNLCSACGGMVPMGEQGAVRHHKLVQCQQCHRILYSEERESVIE